MEIIRCIINEKGQGMVEYGLIISIVVLLLIAVVKNFGLAVLDNYNFVMKNIPI